jgi:membrane protease YdiL (CAAX protease family)
VTTIVAAAGAAILVLLAGNLLWAGFGSVNGLMALNLRSGTSLPWSIFPAILYLWMYWRFISGAWGPAAGALRRRQYLRAKGLSLALWIRAMGAGVLGFAALVALLVVAARLVPLPASSTISTPAGMPAYTTFLLIAMSSLVAGVSEEAAFRGYMQSMIEQRYGLLIAVLANGALFGLLHFGNHPADVLLMLPYYIAVAAVYGGLTWATDSILPAVALHSVGDVIVLARLWLTGRPEWQIGDATPVLVWDSGPDVSFLVAAIAAVMLSVSTAAAFRQLRHSSENASGAR